MLYLHYYILIKIDLYPLLIDADSSLYFPIQKVKYTHKRLINNIKDTHMIAFAVNLQ